MVNRLVDHDGYVFCVCGEWAVSMHAACRSLLTEGEYQSWVDGTSA